MMGLRLPSRTRPSRFGLPLQSILRSRLKFQAVGSYSGPSKGYSEGSATGALTNVAAILSFWEPVECLYLKHFYSSSAPKPRGGRVSNS
jgi:hypothetical protein